MYPRILLSEKVYKKYSFLKPFVEIIFLKAVADIINTPASVHLLLVKKRTTVLALAKQDEQMNLYPGTRKWRSNDAVIRIYSHDDPMM